MNQKPVIPFLVLAAFILASVAVINSEPVNQYMATIKNNEDVIETRSRQNQALEQKVKEMAEKQFVPPDNARIDPVWKAIPGYNGKEVDIEATLRNLRGKRDVSEEDLVYRQISPSVQLEDLEPSPVYRGNPHKPMVSFMINVAWGNEYIPEILEILDRYQVKTTFFLEGKWLKKNPELGRQIAEAGHEIGNHAYSHPDMSRLSSEKITGEIVQTNKVIEEVLEVKPTLFAPPSGDYNQRVVVIADRLGMKTILWTLDTIDWKKPDPQQILNRLSPKLDHGSLILMHPTSSSTRALPSLIEAAEKKGLIPGTVSDVLSPERMDVVE
ncbi:MAG: polysaccharide deacetylase family protein [Bacillaceae bacterium]|nr:polysaccharide deacetylase family protein [Bacillaceae bacterium]